MSESGAAAADADVAAAADDDDDADASSAWPCLRSAARITANDVDKYK